MNAVVPCTSSVSIGPQRFVVVYAIEGNEEQARAKAIDLCFEQTVEFPETLVPERLIREGVVGRLDSLDRRDERSFLAAVSFAGDAATGDLTQWLNMVMGNTSLKPGIRVERIDLGPTAAAFRGPRFGRAGLRELLGVFDRPLLCTALKPMGLPVGDLADLAYRFASGGIDLIKDDHGLADQRFCRFEDRVSHCAAAVARANRETGLRCRYLPNVTAGPDQMPRRATFAKDCGAGGLLMSPGLCGFEAMRQLADDDVLALPILSHPAFQGGFIASPNSGFSHHALFGQIPRLAGADATIFPNFGGRFSFSREDCIALAAGTGAPMAGIRPIFPVPAGGMSVAQVHELAAAYGSELIILVGGGLFRAGPDLAENCRALLQIARQFPS
jgi:ribulose-bisphosphate carboxylase large chain